MNVLHPIMEIQLAIVYVYLIVLMVILPKTQQVLVLLLLKDNV